MDDLVCCLYRWDGVTCVVRAAIRCDRDECPADFFTGLLNAGETINALAARQLTKTKRLVFINISSLYNPDVIRRLPKVSTSGLPPCNVCFVAAHCRGCVVREAEMGSSGHGYCLYHYKIKIMKRFAMVAFSAACCLFVSAAQPPDRSLSPSRQFVIFGADPVVRGAVSGLAEQTKSNLLTLLRQRDDWKTPVIVNLQPQQANVPEIPPADLRFSQTGFGIKLQLDLTISKNLDVSLVERELLRAILLEMMYRKQTNITAGAVIIEPPDWLIDGVLALSPGRDRGQLIEAIVNTGKPLSLENFLRQHRDVLGSTGRTLYRAYSFALVQMLLDEKNGESRLAQYIGHLSDASNDSLADLKVRFPSLADDAEKVWQLALSQLKSVQTFRLLTFSESDQRLDDLLRIKISEPNKPVKVVHLAELAQHKPSIGEKRALDQLKRDLLFFAPQANPVLRPIAREYQEVATLLARGKRRGIAKRLARLEFTRQQLASRMSEIDDYMNWFEATQMKSGSGDFSGYLKAVNQSELPTPRRHDPLSIYIDALEDQFEN